MGGAVSTGRRRRVRWRRGIDGRRRRRRRRHRRRRRRVSPIGSNEFMDVDFGISGEGVAWERRGAASTLRGRRKNVAQVGNDWNPATGSFFS